MDVAAVIVPGIETTAAVNAVNEINCTGSHDRTADVRLVGIVQVAQRRQQLAITCRPPLVNDTVPLMPKVRLCSRAFVIDGSDNAGKNDWIPYVIGAF